MTSKPIPLLASTLCLLHSALAAETAAKPNILLILLDDAGHADFGFTGCKDIPTPNIDRLAATGVTFSDAHVASTVSAPSRAALITGKYGHRFGFDANPQSPDAGLPTDQKTIADLLKPAGYSTAAIGKWHLGNLPQYHPNNRGFDHFFGFLAGGRTYFYNPKNADKPGDPRNILRNQTQVRFDKYLTDLFTNEATRYITETTKPFFLYLAYNAVHTPMEAPPEDLAKFQNHPRQKLAAMTHALDRGIGKIISTLETTGKLQDTLIFFLSDNGGAPNNQSSNLPYKGGKGNKFEGGHRVPFFITWPAKIKPAGTFTALTSSLDIAATALDAARLNPSDPALALDGTSLLPHLAQQKTTPPHDTLYWKKMNTRAIRSGPYKLIQTKNIGTVLYNLDADPAEKINLAGTSPQQIATLLQLLDTWEKTHPAPLWDEGRGWGDIADEVHQLLMSNQAFTSRWQDIPRHLHSPAKTQPAPAK